MALVWVHSTAPAALGRIADTVASAAAPPRFLHIVGSGAADPAGPGPPGALWRRKAGIRYQRVILGFIVEDGGSRWLTDREIGAGVIAAIGLDRAEMVVGTVRPWTRRP